MSRPRSPSTVVALACVLAACTGSGRLVGETGASDLPDPQDPPVATALALNASETRVTVGAPVTFAATVSPTGAGGTVTFLEGSTTLGTAALSSGTATLTLSSLAIGDHALTATYAGGAGYGPSTSAAVSVAVAAPGGTATTTRLAASPGSVTSGAIVTLTATVSPAAATGTVTFLDGSTTLGSAALSAGAASLTTSTLAVGDHTLTAAYAGGAGHAPSASAAVAVTVRPAGGSTPITTTLKVMKFSAAGSDWSTSASAPLEGKVVLAATMSDTTATGAVTFLEGAAPLGSVPLYDGRAVFITSALAAGTHALTARYGGSSTHAESTSSPVSVTIAGAPVSCAAITGGTSFSFFVASYAALQKLSGRTKGFGGNLRFPDRTDTSADAGLKGADTLCAVIADMVEEGSSSCKTWRAFLSTAGKAVAGVSSTAVSARDRVGSGPWHDIQGRRFASSTADFASERPANCDPVICNDLPNETGTLNHAPDGTTIDNHDTLTGSNESGQLYAATATCFDWTSEADTSGYKPQCGHSWPRGSSFGGGNAWISAHNANGCLAGVNFANDGGGSPSDHSVGSGGGYGGFFCFVRR